MKILLSLFLFISISLQGQIPTYTTTISNNAPNGYYMLSPFKFTSPNSWQYIIDGKGELIYYNQLFSTLSLDFKKHANGRLSYFNSVYDAFIILDSLFNPIDTIRSHIFNTDGHELQILPNGHYLLLGVENTYTDLSSQHVFLHNQTAGSHNAKLISNVIQELDANKNVVFEWHSLNHFSFDSADPFWLTDTAKVDWTHSNALEVDTDGNYLLSSRHFNEITKISRSSGNIIWRLGGKYNQFNFTNDSLEFYGQHDCRIVENGHLTLFDDGNHYQPHGARALEYELDLEAMKAKLVWSYVYDSNMYSIAMGNVQRFGNKNTLINYGAINTNSLCFNVVDSLGAELFNIKFENNLYSYRAFYYPNFPWNIQRPQIVCFDSSGLKYFKVEWINNNFSWNNGSTSPILPVTNTGNYYVYAPIGKGGFVRSEAVMVNDINKFCDLTGIEENNNTNQIRIYPNPTQHFINISFNQVNIKTWPKVYDITGKKLNLPIQINDNANHIEIDVSGLTTGLYFIEFQNKTTKFVKTN